MNKSLIPKKNTPDKDKVYTPDYLAIDIVQHFDILGNCLEPCAGDYAFVRALKNCGEVDHVDWMELDEGKDFLLDFPPRKKYDFIVTNPPFSKFRAFLKRSMELANNIIFLCTINHILGLKARLRDIKEKGFFIREVALCETPKTWPSSGFQVGAILLTTEAGDCKFTKL